MRGRSQSVVVNNPMLVRTAPSTPIREGRPRPSSPTSKRPPSLGGSGPPNKTPRFGFFEKEILSFPQTFVSREILRQKEAEQFCKTSILDQNTFFWQMAFLYTILAPLHPALDYIPRIFFLKNFLVYCINCL